MASSQSLDALRQTIREHYLAPEEALAQRLIAGIDLTGQARDAAQARAADFVRDARSNAARSSLIDKFLQEYGLSTAEGVTLMRLAEALLRTPDAATANALIEDKVEAGDWAAHKGKSPFPLVNFSTSALMLTAAWLDDIEDHDPLRKMAAAAKAALDRLGEPVIRAAVAQAMRIMGEHFVLGETIKSAIKRGRNFAQHGYLFSYDMLGEAAHTDADAQNYFKEYEEAIIAIAGHCDHQRAADNPGISVKLSALHPRYEINKKSRVLDELGARVRDLAIRAKDANMGFSLDAEEADRLDISLDLIEQLMRDPALAGWQGFGVVVQAYQRRALFVLDWLAALSRDTGRRIMVRLVKGAYWDSEIKRAQVIGLESYPVFTRKVLTDVSYLACARKLLTNTDVFYPQFATHNALTATMAREMAGDYADYELQRLHGMGEALHDRLIERGARSRIYAPVGGHKELLPYLVRRLLENGANSSFVNQLIDPDLSVDDVVADPFEEIAELETFSNPHIPAPRDHLNGARLAAKGWDETHPPTAASLSSEARSSLNPIAARPIINGALRAGSIAPITNPAHREDTVGSVEPGAPGDVDDACRAAAAFCNEWSSTPAHMRAKALRKAATLLEDRGLHFMALAVFEAGKSWPDAIAEIREAVDFLRYYADECEKPGGAPLGVVACISPWNFPLAIFLGQVSAALGAGNVVIAKPAEQTPLIAFEATRLLHEAGIPAGALHFLPGDGPSVGAALVAHTDIDGVIFTGSTPVAQAIKRSLVETGKHDAALIAETGGVNAMIIDSTALLEQAVSDVIASAFQSAGQRCSACRVVCVQEDIADRFNEMLAGAMAELNIGDPAKLATDVGPVIDHEAMQAIERHIADMERDAVLIARAPAVQAGNEGTFVRPVAFELKKLSDLKREVFGPVVHVVPFKANKLEAMVDDVNALGFGLTMGVHTRIDETMHTIAARARVGNLYVNRNQIGAVVGVQPFGGEGLSGTGPKAGGPHYLKALQKRARPDAAQTPKAQTPKIVPGALGDDIEKKLNAARDAYLPWSKSDRAGILTAVANILTAEKQSLLETVTRCEKLFMTSHALAGPTGESNTLRLRGRGVALCIGDMASTLAMIVLAAGNCVVTTRRDETLQAALKDAGAPSGVIDDIGPDIPEALLLDDRLGLVVYNGGAEGRAVIEAVLARRTGPIIALLCGLDEPWRFATERTLTINTTAAGGDVRLLSLGQ